MICPVCKQFTETGCFNPDCVERRAIREVLGKEKQMITVYKYEIKTDDLFELDLPEDAKILSVQTQNDKPFLWALVDTEKKNKKRIFRLAGTGHEMEKQIANQLEYIGTFQIFNGSFVGHLFEVLSFQQVLAKSTRIL